MWERDRWDIINIIIESEEREQKRCIKRVYEKESIQGRGYKQKLQKSKEFTKYQIKGSW